MESLHTPRWLSLHTPSIPQWQDPPYPDSLPSVLRNAAPSTLNLHPLPPPSATNLCHSPLPPPSATTLCHHPLPPPTPARCQAARQRFCAAGGRGCKCSTSHGDRAECGYACNCDEQPALCGHRRLQRGLRKRLALFHTAGKGWGVKTVEPIVAGDCEPLGRVTPCTATCACPPLTLSCQQPLPGRPLCSI